MVVLLVLRLPLRRAKTSRRDVPKMSSKLGSKRQRREVSRLPQKAKATTVGPAILERTTGNKVKNPQGVSPSPPSILVLTDSKTLARAPQSRAIELMLEESIRESMGFCVGAVGIPTYGKTYLMQKLLARSYEQGLWEIALIHDVKKAVPQYEGAPCASASAFLENAEAYENETSIVFHAATWDQKPPLQDVCEVGRAIAEGGKRIVVAADEVYKGTNGHQDWLKGPPVDGVPQPALYPLFMREGTSQYISTPWTTQIPQQLPVECQSLSTAVAQFHLENLAADAATDKFRLDKDGPRVLRALQRGEFVLYLQGRDWDRTIYGPA